ncbi:MAG: diphosphate--fructose-6-phosphate 1-phosphotransferase [Verrucomicrobiota bacterium]|nr:diphosphate--fructose-6-phosphate 1-phosphotransferase [Verrucomicrobiota bacterium]
MHLMISFLEQRKKWEPLLPHILQEPSLVSFQKAGKSSFLPELSPWFPSIAHLSAASLEKGESESAPSKIGVLFSGGPASGGHNVLVGMQELLPEGGLIGFLGGISGLIKANFRVLRRDEVFSYRNTGGFDLLGSGRTKIETEAQIAAIAKTCKELVLDGLVIIGGDDSQTNAACLSEAFLAQGLKTRVVGVPKTIDGDLQTKDLPISFGFDTACRTYAEMIGNIARDALSSRKYTHFIKLMGRSASHITLECALATQPNLALIGEEKRSLREIVEEMARLIEARALAGKPYGVILIPEGLIEFIPEMQRLIALLGRSSESALPAEEKKLFESLPEKIQQQLLLDRDPHGNVRLSQVATEELLIGMLHPILRERGVSSFSPQAHFFGYEGRAAYPSQFDAAYCLALGRAAVLAVRDRITGALCTIPNLAEEVSKWQVKAVPLISLMTLEERKGKKRPVIAKALVDLHGKAYSLFRQRRENWKSGDQYLYPGPMQFFGEAEKYHQPPLILTS